MVDFNKELLLEALKREMSLKSFAAKFEQLKSYDFNPFRPPKAPEDPAGFDKWREAQGLVNDLVLDLIAVVEREVKAVGEVGKGGEKLDAVVTFLDDIIRLPFYLEWFDGPAIRLLVSQLVGLLNRVFGKDWIEKITAI